MIQSGRMVAPTRFIPLSWPSLGPEEAAAAAQAVREGRAERANGEAMSQDFMFDSRHP